MENILHFGIISTLRTARFAVLLVATVAAVSAEPALTLVPGSDISGEPGDTIGWGYSIFNDSPTDYLAPVGISTGSFADLDPLSIFDFPVIAPDTTVTELFSTASLTTNCSLLPCGLYEVTIPDGTAPEIVTGSFDISAVYCDDAACDNAVTSAPDLTADYSVTVEAVSGTPEPGSLWLLFVGFATVLVGVRKRLAQATR